MAETPTFEPGTVVWQDLTVDNAEEIRDFYTEVVGWESSVHEGTDDFNLMAPGGTEPVTGVCYAKGVNEGIPPYWIIYVAVEDFDESVRLVEEKGGSVAFGPKFVGLYKFCVIRDPAGAYLGLMSNKPLRNS